MLRQILRLRLRRSARSHVLEPLAAVVGRGRGESAQSSSSSPTSPEELHFPAAPVARPVRNRTDIVPGKSRRIFGLPHRIEVR